MRIPVTVPHSSFQEFREAVLKARPSRVMVAGPEDGEKYVVEGGFVDGRVVHSYRAAFICDAEAEEQLLVIRGFLDSRRIKASPGFVQAGNGLLNWQYCPSDFNDHQQSAAALLGWYEDVISFAPPDLDIAYTKRGNGLVQIIARAADSSRALSFMESPEISIASVCSLLGKKGYVALGMEVRRGIEEILARLDF